MSQSTKRTVTALFCFSRTYLLALPFFLPVTANAFHDSELDPQGKQFLVELIKQFQHHCDSGNTDACQGHEVLTDFGEQLAAAQHVCSTGDQDACRTFALGQRHLSRLMQQVDSMGLSLTPPTPETYPFPFEEPPPTDDMNERRL